MTHLWTVPTRSESSYPKVLQTVKNYWKIKLEWKRSSLPSFLFPRQQSTRRIFQDWNIYSARALRTVGCKYALCRTRRSNQEKTGLSLCEQRLLDTSCLLCKQGWQFKQGTHRPFRIQIDYNGNRGQKMPARQSELPRPTLYVRDGCGRCRRIPRRDPSLPSGIGNKRIHKTTNRSSSRKETPFLERSRLPSRRHGKLRGFVVFKGALARVEETSSIHKFMTQTRESLLRREILEENGSQFILKQDYTFSSPTTAAGVFLARNANSRTEWKDANGKTLKEIQEGNSE